MTWKSHPTGEKRGREKKKHYSAAGKLGEKKKGRGEGGKTEKNRDYPKTLQRIR